MKAILFSNYFEAPDELKEFLESIGYNSPINYQSFDLMFDERVINFCEQRLSKLWSEKVYKGRTSYNFRCGFAGAGYIREVDTTRTWRIKYNHLDAPIIEYVSAKVNKYGYLSIEKGESNK